MNDTGFKKRRTLTLRRVLLVLIILALLTVGVVLFGAPIALRILDFAPRGNVDTVWDEIAQAGTEQVNVLPELLSIRPTIRPSAVPTKIATPTPAPTHMSTATPLLLQTGEPVQNLPSTDLPSTTPSIIPTSVATATPVNPYADIFATATTPDTIRILSSGYLDLTLNGQNTFSSALFIGTDTDNRVLGIAEFDEAAIPKLCALYFNNCQDPRFRIDKVDFRPKGMVVYGSINLGIFWQQVGIALLLDSEKRHLELAGIVWNDEIFEVPKSGRFVMILDQLADRGNAALSNLSVLTENYTLNVDEMYFDEDRFIVILREDST